MANHSKKISHRSAFRFRSAAMKSRKEVQIDDILSWASEMSDGVKWKSAKIIEDWSKFVPRILGSDIPKDRFGHCNPNYLHTYKSDYINYIHKHAEIAYIEWIKAQPMEPEDECTPADSAT